jgi:hypothetical protein
VKVVINVQFGGFGLSTEALEWLKARGLDMPEYKIPRDHELLVECVEVLGERADGAYATLRVVEIPEHVIWEIEEYDGNESVVESHRSWR